MKNNPKEKPVVILVAEDDEDHFLLIEEAFKRLGQVTELRLVKEGEELMDYLLHTGEYQDPKAAPRPGLILLDLNMPKKSGREVLGEIKSHADLRRIPVVVLTTSWSQEDIAKSYELGANSFIRKPFGFNEWIDMARSLEHYWIKTVELPRQPVDANEKAE